MNDRILRCLETIGLPSLPSKADENLADHGYDSLFVVLSVSAFESEFSIKIPADVVTEENFSTVAAIAKTITKLGAK